MAVFGGLRAGGGQIGLRCLRVIGMVEVLGIEHRIAIGIPVRGTSVHGAAATLQQAVVDGVTDQAKNPSSRAWASSGSSSLLSTV